MKKNIAILPGDGIGPEVTAQALNVLKAVEKRFGHHFNYTYADVGAIAIEKHGDPLPEATLATCKNSDAILFGAIGHPKYDNDPTAKIRPEQGLLRLRKSLGLFANIRPVTAFPKLLHLSPLKEEKVRGVDFVIFRELTGGIYFGKKGKTESEAYDHCTYSRPEIERIAHLAFQEARKRRGKLTLVDKANVLETSRLWRKVVTEMHTSEYPDIEFDWLYVDNAAMQLIQWPARFDVVLTENMFGDILSDEASVLTGSMGMLPSASVGADTALFEPIHGSYPQAAGKDIANPMAAILSAAMLLDSFDLNEEASVVREAVQMVMEAGFGTEDLQAERVCKCSEIGGKVVELVEKIEVEVAV
ncbi:MAG TPA: 3-isopropylmalate dehydrogenase [Bacteroidetes bacterium]|nr:3-isopropylmalate dehydrogenase [Bacteroidota bacterium]